MKHKNIAIFIPHMGCKNQCSFCNQHTISGAANPPTIEEVYATLQKASADIVDKSTTEIAFFGGSFTAIDRDYMIKLLSVAKGFLGETGFCGIRISTRPDAINDKILTILHNYGVTTIELGAQSMVNRVLEKNLRGHTANDVVSASKLIKQYGFELGLQMMVGLYGDSESGALYTARRIIDIAPKTVRIYPMVILKGTMLEQIISDFEVMPFDHAISLCAQLLWAFRANNIDVIKLGLHASTDIENDICGGIYHPAFRELCESRIYLMLAIEALSDRKNATIFVNPSCVSKMIGQKRENKIKLSQMGYNIEIKQDNTLQEYQIIVE